MIMITQRVHFTFILPLPVMGTNCLNIHEPSYCNQSNYRQYKTLESPIYEFDCKCVIIAEPTNCTCLEQGYRYPKTTIRGWAL